MTRTGIDSMSGRILPLATKPSMNVTSRTGRIFGAMLACRNHVGLLSEDTDPVSNELWGNFPQTYSLVGIINSAMRLSRAWEDVI